MNFLDIRDAIINEESTDDLPLFVKQILSFWSFDMLLSWVLLWKSLI